jgi:hypothetical protein
LIHRTERGELVRSKSEVIISDKLYARKVDYTYDPSITFRSGFVERVTIGDIHPRSTAREAGQGRKGFWLTPAVEQQAQGRFDHLQKGAS